MQYSSIYDVVGRYLFSLCVSAVVTALLLGLMQLAVQNDEPRVSSPKLNLPVDWVLLPKDIDPVVPPLPPLPDVEPPPPIPRQTQWQADSEQSGYEYLPPQLPGPVLPGADKVDGDFIPVMTVLPEYPVRAAQRGIEGWVLVEFTVSETGRVVAPRVVDAFPSAVFNAAALKAVQRYKYKPRVAYGAAVAVHGVKQRIVFSLSAG